MRILADQGWEFLFAGNEQEFITSDDPVTFTAGDDEIPLFRIREQTTKVIPLSKRVSLVIGGEKREFVSKVLMPWATKIINLGVASVAERYIYSSNKNLLDEISKDLQKFKTDPNSFVASPDPTSTPHT